MATSQHRSEIAAQAARWHVTLESETATEGDWLAFEQWLSASAEHRAAYDAIDMALVEASLNKAAFAGGIPTDNVIPLRRWARRPAVWAAGVAAIAACALIMVWRTPEPTMEYAYAASADADQSVTLPDGSSVHLNRNAAIRVSFGATRHIVLERGEAAFDVAHDASRPFEVAAGASTIRDIGTVFNVARNARSTVVTVREGEVEIGAPHAQVARVVAGYQARVMESGAIAVSPANEGAFSWQSGQLIYHDTPLAAVIEDLNRYSDRPIELSQTAAALRFSGVLMLDSAPAMLARLENFLPIRVLEEDDRIIVGSAS